MRSAVSDRRIAFNPCDDVPLPVEDHGEQRFLTATETLRLADEIEPRFRALVLLAAYGGLRFGELAALRRSGRRDQIPDRLDALLFTQDAHQARTRTVVEMKRGDREVL
jgi:hypothetical protein